MTSITRRIGTALATLTLAALTLTEGATGAQGCPQISAKVSP